MENDFLQTKNKYGRAQWTVENFPLPLDFTRRDKRTTGECWFRRKICEKPKMEMENLVWMRKTWHNENWKIWKLRWSTVYCEKSRSTEEEQKKNNKDAAHYKSLHISIFHWGGVGKKLLMEILHWTPGRPSDLGRVKSWKLIDGTTRKITQLLIKNQNPFTKDSHELSAKSVANRLLFVRDERASGDERRWQERCKKMGHWTSIKDAEGFHLHPLHNWNGLRVERKIIHSKILHKGTLINPFTFTNHWILIPLNTDAVAERRDWEKNETTFSSPPVTLQQFFYAMDDQPETKLPLISLTIQLIFRGNQFSLRQSQRKMGKTLLGLKLFEFKWK